MSSSSDAERRGSASACVDLGAAGPGHRASLPSGWLTFLSCPRKPASDLKAAQIRAGKPGGEWTCIVDNLAAHLGRRVPLRPWSALRTLWVCPKSQPTLHGQINYLPKKMDFQFDCLWALTVRQKLGSQKP